MANNLMSMKVLGAVVPSAPSRLLTAPASGYLLVQSIVVSSHEPTAPAVVRGWHVAAAETGVSLGAMSNTMHLAYLELAPERDTEMLQASIVLQPGESISVEQQGGAYEITTRILYSVFSPGVETE